MELGQLFGFNYHLQEKFNQLSQLFIQEKKYQESIEFHQDFINYFKDDKYLCPFYKNLALSYFYQDNDQGISYFKNYLNVTLMIMKLWMLIFRVFINKITYKN